MTMKLVLRFLCSVFWLTTLCPSVVLANAEFNHAYQAAQAGNYKKAIQLWKPLAEQGLPAAQYALAWLYESGQGTPKSYKQAAYWYRQAANQNDLASQYVLASMYEEGLGVTLDRKKAANWYLKAANQGDAIAQFKLGNLFREGVGVEQSDTQSFLWLHRAAKQGHITAQINIGKMYQTGRGIQQNYALAIQWYKQAAEQGNAFAQFQLANMYEYGRGTRQSDQQAKALYLKSAGQYAPSAYKVAEFYEQGKAGNVDLKKARTWYQKAAIKGNSTAQYKLGSLYQQGIGVAVNIHTAIDWYYNAAQQDQPQANYQLGTIYEYGVTDEKGNKIIAINYYKAAQYYQKAYQLDYNLAYERLAFLYENGLGVTMDRKRALSLYQQSTQGSAKTHFNALAKQINCQQTATTKLFSLAIACSNRKALDQEIRDQKIKPIKEKQDNWSDTYFTGAIIKGTSQLQVSYTNESRFASAEYTFIGRNNPKLITQVKALLSKKYGPPNKHGGNVDQGKASFTWLLNDGIELIAWREWPDTTTFVTYSLPEHVALLAQQQEKLKKTINQKNHLDPSLF